MSKGLVYILTNPCLDGWVKIGMTEQADIESRLQGLNSQTSIPLSFRCYAVYEVDNPLEVEKAIHRIIDIIDSSLHAREVLDNGRIREREFFKISPETAYSIFSEVAKLRGDLDKLTLNVPTLEQVQEQEIAESRIRRSQSTFEMLNISIGEELSFLYDDTITVKVADNKNQVEFEGNKESITALAKKLLIEHCGWSEGLHVSGWRYFTKGGLSLKDLRDKIEGSEEDD